jgi:Family of unknown function (DUF6092)
VSADHEVGDGTAQAQPGQLVLSKEEAIELMTYLLASAECCTREPLYYGTFRLLDGASRLAGYVLAREDPRDSWLADFKAELDEKKAWLMWDRRGYYEFLQEAAGRIAERLPRRPPDMAGDG